MSSSLKKAFEQAAAENYWSDADSVSGPGSNMEATRIIRKEIPVLLQQLAVKSMLDAPCGDLFWMKTILPEIKNAGVVYHGADIVQSLVERHRQNFKDHSIHFHQLDITKGPIPAVDLVFTRDCFIHLSYINIYRALRNYKKAGVKYLLTNTYTNPERENVNVDGFFLWGRALNMEKPPFSFGKPLHLVIEGCTEKDGAFSDKSLAVWKLGDISLATLHTTVLMLTLPEYISKQTGKAIKFWKRGIGFLTRRILKAK